MPLSTHLSRQSTKRSPNPTGRYSPPKKLNHHESKKSHWFTCFQLGCNLTQVNLHSSWQSHLQPSSFIHVLVFCLNCLPSSYDLLQRHVVRPTLQNGLAEKENQPWCLPGTSNSTNTLEIVGSHGVSSSTRNILYRSLTPAQFEQEILSISLTPATRVILSLQVKLYVDRKNQIYLYPSQHWDETNKEWKTPATTNIRYMIIKTQNDLHLE